MTELLELQSVSRRFGGVRALTDVNLTLPAGGITGLVGPNGAGKSTLFAIVAGAVKPSSGQILFRGAKVGGWQPHQAARAGVARTFQLMRVFDSMTVLENCEIAAYMRTKHRERAHAVALRALESTNLAEVRDHHVSRLTAASRKRLEIARAVATEPSLLLLDEVLSGLTPAESIEAVEVVRNLHASGITILMVEHVMEVITSLCSRLVVLDHGVVIADGTADVVAHDPRVLEAYLGTRNAQH